MAETIFYKVRDKATGLFSTGGSSPRWSKKGKVWGALGHVKNHLKQVVVPRSGGFRHWYGAPQTPAKHPYENAELVTFRMVEAEAKDIQTFQAEIDAEVEQARLAAEEAEAKRKEVARRQAEEAEKEQLRRLKAKYPNV